MTPHEEKKKDIGGMVTFLVVAILLVGFFGWVFSPSDPKKGTGGPDIKTPNSNQKWSLCWTVIDSQSSSTRKNGVTGRCGSVKKIKFDSAGEVLSMVVRFSTTGVTTKFSRSPGEKKGVWSQPSETGWWALKKISTGDFEGRIQGKEDDEVCRLMLIAQ